MFAVLRSARKSLARAAVVAGALALAACQPGPGGGTGPSINTRAPVPVALLVPGGSDQPGDALLAKSLENAARLAVSDLEGVSVDLRVYNTAGDAGRAAEVARQAVGEGAKIILGPVYAQAANAAGLAVANRNVNVLSFSNNSDIAGGNVFVLGRTFENTADRLVRYAQANDKGRIMVVHDQTVAGVAGSDAIERAIYNAGAIPAGSASYEFSQNGVVQAIPAIKEAVEANQPDALFLTADTSGALPLLAQLLPENGVKTETTQFIGLTRWDIPASTLALPGVQGGWFALPDPALNERFRARYESAFGEGAHPIAGLAYDGVAAIGALVKQGNRDALTTSALTQPSGFVGVDGIFRLRQDGTNERGLAVAEIRDKQVFVIDPAPRSFGGGAGF
jgi:ABC-type branched-subunit amino acid transport system substrate-binding protein